MPYFRIQGPHIQAFTYESGITSLVLSPLSNELNISEDSFKICFGGTVSALPPIPDSPVLSGTVLLWLPHT